MCARLILAGLNEKTDTICAHRAAIFVCLSQHPYNGIHVVDVLLF